MVRLGQDVYKTSQLQVEAMKRTEDAIVQFKRESSKLNVASIVGAATSAVRDAKNGKFFIKSLKDSTGISLKVISGIDEARLILKGIRSFEPLATGVFSFVDIGGGSTEIGVARDEQIFHLESYPLGAARFAQMIDAYPPDANRLFEIRRQVRKVLGENVGFKEWPKVDFILGASGTVKALMKIMKATGEGRKIPRKALAVLVTDMSKFSLAEMAKIPGMEEERVDLILPGAIILEEAMDFLGAKKVFRTKFALREGILQEELERLQLASSRYELEEVEGMTRV